MRTRFMLIAVLASLTGTPAQAVSLTDLLAAVPPPPGDVATALQGMRDGAIIEPALVEIRQRLAAERAALAAGSTGSGPAGTLPSATAASVADSRVVQGYDDYVAAASADLAPAALLGKRTRWVQKAMGQQQLRITQALKPCAEPCTDSAILQHNEQQLQRRMQALTTELEMWAALFADWRAKRGRFVADAEQRLALLDQSTGADPSVRTVAVHYRMAMLDEIELLLSISELAVRRAAAIDRGIDGTEPDSISGATKKAGAAVVR